MRCVRSAQILRAARLRLEGRLVQLVGPVREVPAYQTLSEHLGKQVDEWMTILDHPEVEHAIAC